MRGDGRVLSFQHELQNYFRVKLAGTCARANRFARYEASDYEVDCDVTSHILSRVDCNVTSYIF